MTCRQWLRENNYEDVVALIDEAMAKISDRGSKQRRNWWEILAGGSGGKLRVVEGIGFPVLRAAQLHQRLPITVNAICRNPDEKPPEPRHTGRWPRKKRRRRLSNIPRKPSAA
jgi:hypothetical protein